MEKTLPITIDCEAILISCPDLYLILNPQLIIIHVSTAYLEATMVKRENIIGKHIFTIFPDNPDDIGATGVRNLRESLERVLATKKADTMAVQKYDIRRPESSGGGFEERYWSPRNVPVLNEKNMVEYIIHRVEDVTEYIRLKKLESAQIKEMDELRTHLGRVEIEIFQRAQEIQNTNKELRAKDEQFHLALEASKIGTWIWDITTDAINVDEHMCELFGIPSKQEFPKTLEEFYKLIHPDDIKKIKEDINKSLKDPSKTYNLEYRVPSKDGTTHIIATKGRAYKDEHNRLNRMAGICMDVTEKVATKRQLETLTEELYVSNKKLLASNEELQQFAYIASHDLQEPLRMIETYVQMLKNRYKNQLDSETEEFIRITVNGAERMKALINNLLIFSRIESQKKSFVNVSMQDALDLALANTEELIKKSNAVIQATDLPRVHGDLNQLSLLLQNFITHILRHRNKQSQPEITINTTSENDKWKFAINNNTISIEPQFIEQFFKIFSESQTREEHEGTALGLIVCRRIIERHGGKIWLDTLDKYTTFYFTLPKTREYNAS